MTRKELERQLIHPIGGGEGAPVKEWSQQSQQERILGSFEISQEEYAKNKQKYDDLYYVGYGFDKESDKDNSILTGKYVFGLDRFGDYAGQLKTFKADRDEAGKSIPGSKKRKVRQYIYSLDIPEVEKHILFKSQYKRDHRYNSQIVDYLNDRKDITYRQMADVLTELGMAVDEEGYITW